MSPCSEPPLSEPHTWPGAVLLSPQQRSAPLWLGVSRESSQRTGSGNTRWKRLFPAGLGGALGERVPASRPCAASAASLVGQWPGARRERPARAPPRSPTGGAWRARAPAGVGPLAPGHALSSPATRHWGHVRVYPQERRSGCQELWPPLGAPGGAEEGAGRGHERSGREAPWAGGALWHLRARVHP